tara:strand:+ start:176 stop:817 length:642 start_codon:yes stop_codon:yes gene_type:complete
MYNKENITRKSNLDANDSLSAYLNHTCQQNPNCFEEFYKLLLAKKPKRILEIGTAQGGLTTYLKYMCDALELDTQIRSYDVNELPWFDAIREQGIDLCVENIFEPNYTGLANDEVIDFIQGDGVTLVLCDGGSKVREFNILSEYIKPLDIIMAHDYAFDSDYFTKTIKGKFWNWHEISEQDIKDCSDKFNLKPFMQDGFTKAVWVCKIKKEKY